jgi:hypothetical protein
MNGEIPIQGHSKDTFLQIDYQAKLAQPLKNQAQVKKMCLKVGTSFPEVIQGAVGERKAGQNSVHDPLKTAARIAKAKRLPPKLEEAEGGDDSCFLSVL